MTILFNALKDGAGVLGSAQIVCVLVCGIATIALWRLRETFGIDLNYVEVTGRVSLDPLDPSDAQQPFLMR